MLKASSWLGLSPEARPGLSCRSKRKVGESAGLPKNMHWKELIEHDHYAHPRNCESVCPLQGSKSPKSGKEGFGFCLMDDSVAGLMPSRSFRSDAAFLLTFGSFLLTMDLLYLQLTILAFLLTVGAFLFTILAFLLTIQAFLLTVGKCI